MAYATAAEMKALLGSERLRRMIPDLTTEALDASLAVHLDAASAEIDSRIAAVYSTPVSTSDTAALARLRDVTIALAARRMTLGVKDLPASVSETAKAADAWLDRVAQRQARLPGVSSKARPVVQAFVDDSTGTGEALDPAVFVAAGYI